MENAPLFSIAIPTYNRLRLLKEALESAQAQTYPNIEIVIFDNHSDDGTFEYIQARAQQDSRIKIVRNSENIGGLKNMWHIPDHTQGKYLLILSDDDAIDPALCKTAVTELQACPSATIWLCGHDHFFGQAPYQNANATSVKSHLPPGKFSHDILVKKVLLQKAQFVWCGTVYLRETLIKVDGFQHGSFSLDWTATLCTASQGDVYFNPAILAHYRLSNQNTSGTLFAGDPLAEMQRQHQFYDRLQLYFGDTYRHYFLYHSLFTAMARLRQWKHLKYIPVIFKEAKRTGFSGFYSIIFIFYLLPKVPFRILLGSNLKVRFKSLLKRVMT